MCNVSGRLIAWLDHELPETEAADVGRHVTGCAECQRSISEFSEASKLFDAYCEAVMASKERRTKRAWTPVLAAAAAIAAVAAMLLAFQPAPVEPLPVHSQAAAPSPTAVLDTGRNPIERNQLRSAVRRQQRPLRNPRREPMRNEEANWLASGQAIQIAIPGDAMFPPGAVPEGVNFVADLSIGADGWAGEIRLRP